MPNAPSISLTSPCSYFVVNASYTEHMYSFPRKILMMLKSLGLFVLIVKLDLN